MPGRLRALAVLALALAVITCRDVLAPGAVSSGRIAVAPILPSAAALADFGLTIDAVRFVVVRPQADTLADTTVALPPEATELALDLRVPLISRPETLSVSVVALSGSVPLFAGTRLISVPTPLPPPEIAVDTYVGPVADSIVIQPRSPVILLNDSLRFQIQGFNGGVPVTQFYVAWSTSDSAVAAINHFGVLRAPAVRGSVRVRARTPSGASDSVTAVFAPPATLLAPAAGNGQTDTVGQQLNIPLEVEARAADGLGVAGVTVRFRSLAGGGAVTDSVVVTNLAGRARTTATLGGVLGAQTFEASAASLAGSPILFTVVALAGLPSQLLAVAGDGQLATVATALATRPTVQVTDAAGNPGAGVSVAFTVASGGGSVVGGTQLTNAAGVATVGGWTLGTVAGPNTMAASVSGVTPVTFTATGTAGAPSHLVKLDGDGQTAVVNLAVATAPSVRLTDGYGNPIAGDTVNFFTLTDGGFPANPTPVTDASGVATAGSWTLATFVGPNVLQASVPGAQTVQPVSFTATGTPDIPAQLLRLSVDSQNALINTAVATPPAVAVADQYGNRLAGQAVQFVVTSLLGGSVTPGSATTDSTGAARAESWVLGVTAGLNTLEARVPGLIGSPVLFKGLGFASTATTIALDSGDGQIGVVGRLLAGAYSVVVTDATGARVAGVPVAWAVDSLGGTITATSSTDALGIATATRTLGGRAGVQTATAMVNGLTNSPVRFTATALADTAFRILKIAGDTQTATVGTLVTTAPAVRVTDVFGNPIARVQVTFTPDAVSGVVTAAIQTTDTAGVATVGGWTLGTTVGPQTLTASAGTLTPVNITAQATAGPAAQLAFLTQPVKAFAGNVLPVVRVGAKDRFGNLAAFTDSVNLGLRPLGSPATLGGTLDVAAIGGVATFGDLRVDSANTGYTLVASAIGVSADSSKPFDIAGVVAAVPVVQGGFAAAVNPNTSRIYVPGTSAVSVVDGVKAVELTQLPGFELPSAVAVNAATDTIYVSTAGGVVPIEGLTNRVLLPILVGTNPQGVAVDDKTNTIYVAVATDLAKGGPALVVIDGSKDAVTGSVPLDDVGQGVAFDAASGQVFVAIPGLNQLAIVDPVNLKVVGTRLVGASPHGVAADNGIVYVTNNRDNYVFVLDAFTLEEKARVPVGKLPEGIDVDPARGIVYVANAGEQTMSLIETGKFTVFATLQVAPAGASPRDAAVNRMTGFVYVPTTDGKLRVVQP